MLMTKAYAKINLEINVINKDEQDSYHNLDMVIVPIELHDRIEIEVLPFGFDTLITSRLKPSSGKIGVSRSISRALAVAESKRSIHTRMPCPHFMQKIAFRFIDPPPAL